MSRAASAQPVHEWTALSLKTKMLRIGIVAGEASGDQLGAGLIRAIKERVPDAVFEGVAGPKMIEAGCTALFPVERLAVMGLVEVLGRLPELLRIRARLRRHFLDNPPDVFIGIDAPDFNLGLERSLKAAGITTVHYVSPTVWAWRQGRVNRLARSMDLMLTIFPFEADFYAGRGMDVRFVGHPLADLIPDAVDRHAARRRLGLPEEGKIVALLPGSRSSELRYLGATFVQTAAWCRARRRDLVFVAPMANAGTRTMFEEAWRTHAADLPLVVVDGQSHDVMAAVDAVLAASGTATLETVLFKRPLVVAYRVAPLSHWIFRTFRLIKVPYIAMANLLAGREIAKEFIQDAATPENLGQAVLALLEDEQAGTEIERVFGGIHRSLRRDASRRAAEAVLELVERKKSHESSLGVQGGSQTQAGGE